MRGSAVLVHGGWGDPEDWWWVRRRLEEAGVEVHAPDLPSSRSAASGLAEDGEEVREVLRSATAPVVLVGWSWGGDVIGVASRGEPSVAHLLYVACGPRAAGSPGPGVEWMREHPHIALTDRGTSRLDDVWWLEEEAGTTRCCPSRTGRRRRRGARTCAGSTATTS